MEENINVLEMFRTLREIKKQENFRLALMSKEQLVSYIVDQMELVENEMPQMVIPFDDEPIDDNPNEDNMDRR